MSASKTRNLNMLLILVLSVNANSGNANNTNQTNKNVTGLDETISIDLPQALTQALLYDAQIASMMEKQASWEHLSQAENTWDDPKLVLGAQAVPLDSYDLSQEPMTQLVIGYQQMLPRGNSLQKKAAVMQANANAEAWQIELRKRQILRGVKKSWYDVWYQHNAIQIIQENRHIFVEILDINQSFYASGRIDQQSIVQAELDVSMIDDQLQTLQSELLVNREAMTRWLGGDFELNMDEKQLQQMPASVKTLDVLEPLIKSHPQLAQANAMLDMSKSALELEKEKYSAQWGVDVRYGYRQGENTNGSERVDFLSAMVSVDLPVFIEQKQDRQVAASRSQMQSVRYQVIDLERELLMQLKQTHARLVILKQRLVAYTQKINKQAKQNAEVAMRGYQSGVVDFVSLSKAQVMQLNVKLAELKLLYEFKKTKSDLEYLVGEML